MLGWSPLTLVSLVASSVIVFDELTLQDVNNRAEGKEPLVMLLPEKLAVHVSVVAAPVIVIVAPAHWLSPRKSLQTVAVFVDVEPILMGAEPLPPIPL